MKVAVIVLLLGFLASTYAQPSAIDKPTDDDGMEGIIKTWAKNIWDAAEAKFKKLVRNETFERFLTKLQTQLGDNLTVKKCLSSSNIFRKLIRKDDLIDKITVGFIKPICTATVFLGDNLIKLLGKVIQAE